MNASLQIPLDAASATSSMLSAILSELAEHLQQLAEHGRSQTIDLSGLPLNHTQRQQLEKLLGRGEVDITLNTIGESHIVETAYSGIWWIRHYSADNQLISELIEISIVPDIIKSHPQEIKTAAQKLLLAQQTTGENL